MSDQELNHANPNADESSLINETSALETVSTHEVVSETTIVEPVATSAETAEAPAETAEAPAETAEAPAETAEAPAETAEALAEPVEATAETAEAPAETAEATAETVEATAETVEATTIPATVEIEQDTSAADKRKEEKEKRKQLEEEQAAITDTIHADQSVIEVTVAERIKGGLRLDYNGTRLFMPASHFGLKRAPSDKELTDAVGTAIPVQIIEIQKDENGRRTVVASRRKLLRDSFFGSIKEGDIVEGTVSSLTTFGIFVDINGVEGMVHISRMASYRIADPSVLFKKGDHVKATVSGIDSERGRLALSTKDFVSSPWDAVETKYPTGTVVKGIAKRFTDFGTYVEIEPGLEGLLRNADLVWGRRGVFAQDLLQEGVVIDLAVLNSSAEKKRIGLSLKHMKPNPWKTIQDTHPAGSNVSVTVSQVNPNGLLVNINEDFDGFVPRSKVRNVSGKNAFAIGDTFEATIVDSNGDTESLVLAPQYTDEELASIPQRNQNSGQNSGQRSPRDNRSGDPKVTLPDTPTITIMDLLSEAQKSNLKGS